MIRDINTVYIVCVGIVAILINGMRYTFKLGDELLLKEMYIAWMEMMFCWCNKTVPF